MAGRQVEANDIVLVTRHDGAVYPATVFETFVISRLRAEKFQREGYPDARAGDVACIVLDIEGNKSRLPAWRVKLLCDVHANRSLKPGDVVCVPYKLHEQTRISAGWVVEKFNLSAEQASDVQYQKPDVVAGEEAYLINNFRGQTHIYTDAAIVLFQPAP